MKNKIGKNPVNETNTSGGASYDELDSSSMLLNKRKPWPEPPKLTRLNASDTTASNNAVFDGAPGFTVVQS